MTSPDELVRDGLLRIADQAAPVSGSSLAAQVITAAERRHRRTLATTVTAVVAVLLLGAVTATTLTGTRRHARAAGPLRTIAATGPVAVGWYHVRGLPDDAFYVADPATGRYRLLRGEEIFDISPNGRTALARPYAVEYPRQVDMVDLAAGTAETLTLQQPVLDARWSPDGVSFAVTVGRPAEPSVREGVVIVQAGGLHRDYHVSLPEDTFGGQAVDWDPDGNTLWTWADPDGAAGIAVALARYDLTGRRLGMVTLRTSDPHGAVATSNQGPWLSPDGRRTIAFVDELPVQGIFDVATGAQIGFVRHGMTMLEWYDGSHAVVQDYRDGGHSVRVVVIALDGTVTKVLVPWQPASLRADFHVYRRG